MSLMDFIFCFCSSEIKKDFPCFGMIFKSGSKSLLKDKLKSFNPLKTESTTNKAIAPTITPPEAIPVIMFMALFLLEVRKYRLAM